MAIRPMSVGTPRMRRLILLGAVLLVAETGSARQIETPGEKGRYNVGFTTFCATMSAGRVTRVQVFYPTLDRPELRRRVPRVPSGESG